MTDELVQTTPDRSAARARFLGRFQRYGNLLRNKWWILVLGIVLGVAVQLVLWQYATPSFTSVGRMIVNIKLAIPEGSVYTEEWANFRGRKRH